jgi:anti-anti-sigma factor
LARPAAICDFRSRHRGVRCVAPNRNERPEDPQRAGPHAPSRSDELDDDFRLTVVADAHGTVVVAEGELDIATTPQLEAVIEVQTGYVVVDLREVSFADASALHALLRAEGRSRHNGDSVAFLPGGAVERVMGVLGLADQLTLAEPPATSGA